MNNLISEFFYEGIRRIVPGLVVIAFYLGREPLRIFGIFQNDLPSYAIVACVLLLAWLIGIIIEQITSFVAHGLWTFAAILFGFFFRRGIFVERWASVKRIWQNNDKPAEENKSKPPLSRIRKWLCMSNAKSCKGSDIAEKREKRRQDLFFFAEKVMCRNLAVVFLIAIFRPPDCFLSYPYCYRLFGFGIFFFCWIWAVLTDPGLAREDEKKPV